MWLQYALTFQTRTIIFFDGLTLVYIYFASILRSTFTSTMCYIYMNVCIFCGKQEIYGMKLCMNRMRIGLCLSYDYNSEVINENRRSYVKAPVERNEITGGYKLRMTHLIHTEYSVMLCKGCEERGVHSGVETFDD